MTEYRGEVWQRGNKVATAEGAVYRLVNAETAHYAMMYAQDGPVEVRFYEKKPKKKWKRT